jgi:hypothetical protein
VWVEQQKLTASDATRDAFFGNSVALSFTDRTALVGAPRVESAYVFEK